MNSRVLLLSALLCTALSLQTNESAAQPAPAIAVPVQGQVVSSQGPVPGVTVFLVHQVLGRSAPSYTDLYGRFGWSAIPVRPEPYFLEIYWGPRLIYRQPILVSGPLALPPIHL